MVCDLLSEVVHPLCGSQGKALQLGLSFALSLSCLAQATVVNWHSRVARDKCHLEFLVSPYILSSAADKSCSLLQALNADILFPLSALYSLSLWMVFYCVY